jgi:SNF2 family DNA or RNA helicase
MLDKKMNINPKYNLFPYQEKCVRWMNKKQNGILFAEMGLGKTLMTLKFLSDKKGPHLVICGKTLIGGWLGEIEKFCKPNPKVFVYHNEFNKNLDIDLSVYDIILTTYGKVVSENKYKDKKKISDYFFFKENIEGRETYKIKDHTNRVFKKQKLFGVYWESIICDECQLVCNWKTARYQAIYSLPSKRLFGLSGTPIKNDRSELIGLCKFLKIKDYNYPSRWKKSDTVLKDSLFTNFHMITYSTANMVLPPIEEKGYELDFSDNTIVMINDYLNMWNEFVKTTTDNNGEKMTKLMSLFIRLRQISIDPCLIGVTEAGVTQHKEITNSEPPKFGSEKFTKLKEIIKENHTERFIVFSFFTSYLEMIVDKLERPTYLIRAKYSIRKRFEVINEWKRSDNGILMMNYKLGAEGLNLTEATQIVLLDSWFNFTCESQAIARAHRIGQTKKVTVHRIVYKSSIEIIMYRKCREKKNLFHKLKNKEEIKQRGSIMSYENMSKYLEALQGGVASVMLERDLDEDEIEYIRNVYKTLMNWDKTMVVNILEYLVDHTATKIFSILK